MMADRALGLLRGLVAIPSYSGREQALAAYLAEAMTRLGFRTALDPTGNVVGELGDPQGPLVLLLGHLDTVPGAIPVREEGGVLFGRGVVDAKGPLASLVMAADAGCDAPVRVVVVGAVEEETPGSRGARALLDRFEPAAVVVGEPGGWSSVTIGYKGRVSFTYELSRPPSHSAGCQEKASDAAVEFWSRITGHLEALGAGSSDFHRPTATLAAIAGSPVHARIEATCRVPPAFDLEAFAAFVRGISRDGGLWFSESTPAVVTDRSALPVRALVGAIRRHAGQPTLKLKTGTSDMNVVAGAWRAPMAAYGPGDPALSHTLHERLELDEYLRAVAVLRDALRGLARELGATASRAGDPPLADPGPGRQRVGDGAPDAHEALRDQRPARLAS
jgi:LysW-gamma-L-lysine carboxypeptidase